MDLVRHQCSQTALLCIQLYGVKYPLADHMIVKWSADIVRYSKLERPTDTGVRFLTGNHDNRNIFNPPVPVHVRQYLEAIHDRHDNIKKNR